MSEKIGWCRDAYYINVRASYCIMYVYRLHGYFNFNRNPLRKPLENFSEPFKILWEGFQRISQRFYDDNFRMFSI